MDTMNPEHASQNGIRYNFTSSSTVYDDRGMPVPSSDSYFDDSQTLADSDDSTLLVDHLANNYGLDNDSRGELHAFSEASLYLQSSYHPLTTFVTPK
jgi:hypothetical protein